MKYAAELFGTFVLVFAGLTTAVISGGKVGNVGVAMAFGLSLLAMAPCLGRDDRAELHVPTLERDPDLVRPVEQVVDVVPPHRREIFRLVAVEEHAFEDFTGQVCDTSDG